MSGLPLGCTTFGRELIVPGGNFYWHEWACKPHPHERAEWGTYIDVPEDLRDNVVRLVTQCFQPLRECNGPIQITGRGGFRPKAYNAHRFGATDSYHCKGMAGDAVSLVTHNPAVLRASALMQRTRGLVSFGGVGLYPDFVHFDIRTRPAGAEPVKWFRTAKD